MNDASRILVLFVHGLNGSAERTWGRFPSFLRDDPDHKERIEIAFFSYPTMLLRTIFSRRAPTIQELAAALRTRIENRYPEFQTVVLVCHSLGGLIARQYLLQEVKAKRTLRVKGIALFATPNNGAALARIASAISWRHHQTRQLCRNSDLIELLNTDWFSMGVEELVPVRYVAGTQDRVVDRFSAAGTWGNPNVETVVGKGHIDLVKPGSADDDVVLILKRFLKQLENASDPGNKARIATEKGTQPVIDTAPEKPVRKEDWEEELDVTEFHGRDRELSELQRDVAEARLVAIIGRGGMGKSALLRRVGLDVTSGFDCVLWRSLKHGRTLDELLASCLRVLRDESTGVLPQEGPERLQQFSKQLNRLRCLLLLDNVESIMNGDQAAGRYRPGYENYLEFFETVATTSHRSCVVLTSRELPEEISRLSGSGPVRVFSLKGVDADVARRILRSRDVEGDAEEIGRLVTLYDGNPQAIKLVATPIRTVFGGHIATFLKDGEPVFGEIERCLEWHFERTTERERDILFWMAIRGEPLSRESLWVHLMNSGTVSRGAFQEAIESLDGRSLLESSNSMFFLQGLVLEYVVRRLVDQAKNEIVSGSAHVLLRYPLLIATARDPIRRMQERVILGRLLESLGHLSKPQLKGKLMDLLVVFRSAGRPGYLAGNVINLLRIATADLSGLDLSGLCVWSAYLQETEMHDANLTNADLSGSIFSETFGDILSVACSPTDDLVATGSTNGDVTLWRISDGSRVMQLDGHLNEVWTLAFSPGGEILVSGGEDETIRLWDVRQGREYRLLTDPKGPVFALAFDPNGTRLAYGGDNQTFGIHHLVTGVTVNTEGHPGGIYAVAWSADGYRVATGANDHTVRLWRISPDLSKPELEREMRGHSGWVRSLSFTPTGRCLASGGYDNSIRLWNPVSGECEKVLQGHTGWVRCVAFRDDQSLASGSDDGTVRVWNVGQAKCTRVFEGHVNTVWCLSWSADGTTIVSGGNDQTIRYWELASGECAASTRGFVNAVRAIEFNPDGALLASGGADRKVRLWTMSAGEKSTLNGHTDWIRTMAFSPDGRTLFTAGNDRTIRIWDVQKMYCKQILTGHENWIYGLATADGNTLVSCSSDQSIRIHDLAAHSSRVLYHSDGGVTGCYSVALSSDGGLIASGGNDCLVRIRDSNSLCCMQTLKGHTNTVYGLSFDGAGRRLASSGDKTARIWDTASGKMLQVLRGHSGWVRTVRLSKDGLYAVTASDDGTVKFWECKSGACLWTGKDHSGIVWSVRFDPTEEMIVSGSNDETIRFWDRRSGVCTRVLRNSRPYEGTKIAGAIGLLETRKRSLRALGATD